MRTPSGYPGCCNVVHNLCYEFLTFRSFLRVGVRNTYDINGRIELIEFNIIAETKLSTLFNFDLFNKFLFRPHHLISKIVSVFPHEYL